MASLVRRYAERVPRRSGRCIRTNRAWIRCHGDGRRGQSPGSSGHRVRAHGTVHRPGARAGHRQDQRQDPYRNIPPADAVPPPCRHARVKRIGRWRKEHLMARSTARPVVRLKSAAGTGVTYVTRKNRLNDPDRLVLRKYDPVAGEHVLFREER